MTNSELFEKLMKGFNLAPGGKLTINGIEIGSGGSGRLISCPECQNTTILDQWIVINGLVLSHQMVHGLKLPNHSTIPPEQLKVLQQLEWEKRK